MPPDAVIAEPATRRVDGETSGDRSPSPAPARPAGRSDRRRRLTGVIAPCAVASGIASILVGTMALNDRSALPRVVFVVLGIGLVYGGLDRLGKAVFGRRFELGIWLSAGWMGLIILAAIFADALPLSESKDVSKTLRSPTLLRPDLFSAHPLGTDRQGLDILGGIVYGARVSLAVAFGAVVLGTIVGGLIGLSAGWFRGKVDAVVRFFTDSLLAFPPLILLLGMVAVVGASILNVTVALAVLSVPIYIRLSRVNTMVFAQRDFVLASKVLGARGRRIIFRELMPNVALPVLSYGFVVLGVLIVAEASLSFLGLSISRPNPTWGNMIAAGQDKFKEHPHLVLAPGTILFITVFALNRIGDKARALWNPQHRRL